MYAFNCTVVHETFTEDDIPERSNIYTYDSNDFFENVWDDGVLLECFELSCLYWMKCGAWDMYS